MGRSGRSRTAQGVLAERAVLADMGVLADPFAPEMLTPSMRLVVFLAKRMPQKIRAGSETLAGLAARVCWFDNQIAQALDAGIDQFVAIGAGYDSRAWRFAHPGVQFFELDHAGTQGDKIRRAPAPGPRYVEADLIEQSAADALVAGGFDESRPSHFALEGVSMYLDEKVVRHQLGELWKVAASGGRLAVDFYPPGDAGTVRNQRQLRLQRVARVGSGEKFRMVVDRVQAVELVQDCGWEVTKGTSLREVARNLVRRDAGLPVNSVNEYKTLVAAVRP